MYHVIRRLFKRGVQHISLAFQQFHHASKCLSINSQILHVFGRAQNKSYFLAFIKTLSPWQARVRWCAPVMAGAGLRSLKRNNEAICAAQTGLRGTREKIPDIDPGQINITQHTESQTPQQTRNEDINIPLPTLIIPPHHESDRSQLWVTHARVTALPLPLPPSNNSKHCEESRPLDYHYGLFTRVVKYRGSRIGKLYDFV